MKLGFTKKFDKQISKLNSQKLKDEVASIIEEAEKASNFSGIKNVKKLSGFKYHYRIKLGNYRIGLFLNGDILEFAAFDDRKDIYKHFP
jgi:mRNA interferase RelE/StbE